jgi:hypothetical protein
VTASEKSGGLPTATLPHAVPAAMIRVTLQTVPVEQKAIASDGAEADDEGGWAAEESEGEHHVHAEEHGEGIEGTARQLEQAGHHEHVDQ